MDGVSAYLGKQRHLITSRRSAVDEFAHTQQAHRKLHDETWQASCSDRACGFPWRWTSFLGVLLRWLVFLVLITLLCHLGQTELLGTCWVGHSWRKQMGLGYGCSVVP